MFHGAAPLPPALFVLVCVRESIAAARQEASDPPSQLVQYVSSALGFVCSVVDLSLRFRVEGSRNLSGSCDEQEIGDKSELYSYVLYLTITNTNWVLPKISTIIILGNLNLCS